MDVDYLTQQGSSWRRERVCGRCAIRKNCGNLWKRQKAKEAAIRMQFSPSLISAGFNFPKKIEAAMEIRDFFLDQYDTVCWIVNNLFVKDLSDAQLRHQPKEGLNSIAWYMWHTARWQDFANTLIEPGRKQVLDKEWLARMNLSRRDVGTGMTREECTEFNRTVGVDGLKSYWNVVGEDVRDVARSVSSDELGKPVDSAQLQSM